MSCCPSLRIPCLLGEGLTDPSREGACRTMPGSLGPRMGLGLLLLALVLVAGHAQPQRYQPLSLPGELEPMELPNGLMDDYGILPKHPGPRVVLPLLPKVQKRKRDGPDLSDYYYDAPQ